MVEQKSFAAGALKAASVKEKKIRIREGSTSEEITRRLAMDAPTLDRNPEYFLPARLFAQTLLRGDKPMPATITYQWTVKTNQGPMEVSGTTETDETGFFAILIPDGLEVKINIQAKDKP